MTDTKDRDSESEEITYLAAEVTTHADGSQSARGVYPVNMSALEKYTKLMRAKWERELLDRISSKEQVVPRGPYWLYAGAEGLSLSPTRASNPTDAAGPASLVLAASEPGSAETRVSFEAGGC